MFDAINLQNIRIERSMISTIAPKAFEHLQSLETLSLSMLSSITLAKDTFALASSNNFTELSLRTEGLIGRVCKISKKPLLNWVV